MFALVVAVGITEGQDVVALGIAAAPLFSLAVVPWALRRRLRSDAPPDGPEPTDATPEQAEFTLAHGAGFAGAVLMIMVAEQTFLNGGPLLVKATEGDRGAALAGFAFNVLLIARAPLQLFQAVQTSILPHLTKLSVSGQPEEFRRSVRVTLRAIAAFAGAVALAMLALGPQIMDVAFGAEGEYDRGGLVLVAAGMGLYLSAATLNQAALAAGRTKQAAACWVGSAAAFVVVLLVPSFHDAVLKVEVAYVAGALLLCGALYALYRTSDRA
jgi:O-antigen/teichoic acid export membrane protein